MFNIKIRGDLKDEEQLKEGEVLPENSIMLNEGNKITDIMFKGFALALPGMLVMIALSYFKCKNMSVKLSLSPTVILAAISILAAIKLLTYVHEFIHAIVYPLRSRKSIWKYKEQGVVLIYCSAKISRIRFIIMSAAPSVILGIVPFIYWMRYGQLLQLEWRIASLIVIWIMYMMSMGDFANIYNVIKQTPGKAVVFNYGLHTYWMRKQKK